MAARMTTEERLRIIELLGQGHTLGHVARTTNRSPSTIHRIAHEIGHAFDRSLTKKGLS